MAGGGNRTSNLFSLKQTTKWAPIKWLVKKKTFTPEASHSLTGDGPNGYNGTVAGTCIIERVIWGEKHRRGLVVGRGGGWVGSRQKIGSFFSFLFLYTTMDVSASGGKMKTPKKRRKPVFLCSNKIWSKSTIFQGKKRGNFKPRFAKQL